jgi:uncharacterized membrane protein SpoIIM required for sporulation
MRESSFIQQNKEKWKDFEQVLDQKDKDPDKLNDLFIQITDDLSYSRTFYPNRSVRVYLNGLAQKVFFSIYKTKQSRRSRLIHFWIHELPRLVYEGRKEFRLAFLLFLLSFLIGVFSSVMDPEYAEVILGSDYISMTLENIESGDPMAVYKQRGAFGMSLSITANNLFVAFLTFVLGAFWGIGSVGILVRNGAMVGTFQYFFIEKGLFWESFLTIWIHGTLEISAIIIAGAAGLTMGKGLIFPGTLSRLKSFQISARRGLKIMMGIAPIIIMAGFFEGYLTRHTEAPDILRAFFILICLSFVLIYFVWYPRYRARKGFVLLNDQSELPPDTKRGIDTSKIKSSGELFADTFIFLRQQLGKIAGMAALAAAVYCGATFIPAMEEPHELFAFPWETFGTLSILPDFFLNTEVPWIPLIHFVVIAFFSIRLFDWIEKVEKEAAVPLEMKKQNTPQVLVWLKALIGSAVIVGMLLTMKWFTVLFILFLFPVAMIWMYAMQREGIGVFRGIQRLGQLLSGETGRLLGLGLILTLIGFLFFALLDTTVMWFILQTVGMNFAFEQSGMDNLATVLLTFMTMFMLYMVIIILLIGSGLSYYTLLEIREAPHLRKRLQGIGFQERIQGMVKES